MALQMTSTFGRSGLPYGYAHRGMSAIVLVLALLVASISSCFAAETIGISRDDAALDLTRAADIYNNRGPTFQVSTAPDADGIVRTIEVEAVRENASGHWAVFILANTTSEQIDRLIVAPHYRLVDSGFFWPDLGSSRIANITPSEGFSLERIESRDSDVFSITLNPGAVITFVAELASPTLPQLYLWEEEAYKEVVNSYTLYYGIVLGIAGLLALFLTVIFVVRGTTTFPVAATLAWAALAYVCIDFGFIDQFFLLEAEELRFWRALSEGTLAAALTLFLFTYLSLNRWSDRIRNMSLIWLVATLALSALVFRDPQIAAGVARISIALTAIIGLGAIIYTGYKGYDRAVMLIPSWALLIAFVVGAWMIVSGSIDNDIVQPALTGALILIVLMIGFTVMQNAFAGGAFQQNLFSNTELQALAVKGSDAIVWSWDVTRDKVATFPDVSLQLGADKGALQTSPKQWLKYLHGEDRDRFWSTLEGVVEQRRGRLSLDLRMRTASNHYRWFRLLARPVVGSHGEVIRCVGTLANVDDQKRSEERMMQDAVHDNLTGLPNRELFLDRVKTTATLASASPSTPPTVFIVDLDRFREINEGIGISAGDTLLISVARRLRRLLQPHDTVARISGDQFGIVLLSESEPKKIAALAETIKNTIRSPIEFAGRDIVLTASVGLATWTPSHGETVDLFGDAELALFQAKRFGGDRVEPFRPAFRSADANKLQLEADLRRALERDEISIVYQPIADARTGLVVGFEALMRWTHPRRGDVSPGEFIALAERSDLIVELGNHAISTVLQQLMDWDALTDVPVFVSVNVSAPQIERADFVQEVGQLMSRYAQHRHRLRLEITETCVMANPEYAVHVLNKLKALDIELALDDFGTGYSSLSYLARFPFDTLKIDKSFLGMDSATRTALLRSMIDMAHALDLAVIAEGIEDDQTIGELQDLECDYIQGFAAGRPLTAEEAMDLVREQNPVFAIGKAAE